MAPEGPRPRFHHASRGDGPAVRPGTKRDASIKVGRPRKLTPKQLKEIAGAYAQLRSWRRGAIQFGVCAYTPRSFSAATVQQRRGALKETEEESQDRSGIKSLSVSSTLRP